MSILRYVTYLLISSILLHASLGSGTLSPKRQLFAPLESWLKSHPPLRLPRLNSKGTRAKIHAHLNAYRTRKNPVEALAELMFVVKMVEAKASSKGGQKYAELLPIVKNQVGQLLSADFDASMTTSHGETALGVAIWFNAPIQIISQILGMKGVDVNAKDKSGFPPVLDAIYKNRLDVLRALAEKGADFTGVYSDGKSLLMKACEREASDALVFFVLERTKNVNAPNIYGETALYLACLTGKDVIVQELLRKGANPVTWTARNGQTPLHVCARKGSVQSVEAFLKAGAMKNARNYDDETAFDVAKWHERPKEMLDLLAV